MGANNWTFLGLIIRGEQKLSLFYFLLLLLL
ncbi:MAG: hypothetical protein MRERC_9c001, partial [Mycoplasmataceae bacterium RC_NB112A]